LATERAGGIPGSITGVGSGDKALAIGNLPAVV
jgi:hypothetical protein